MIVSYFVGMTSFKYSTEDAIDKAGAIFGAVFFADLDGFVDDDFDGCIATVHFFGGDTEDSEIDAIDIGEGPLGSRCANDRVRGSGKARDKTLTKKLEDF